MGPQEGGGGARRWGGGRKAPSHAAAGRGLALRSRGCSPRPPTLSSSGRRYPRAGVPEEALLQGQPRGLRCPAPPSGQRAGARVRGLALPVASGPAPPREGRWVARPGLPRPLPAGRAAGSHYRPPRPAAGGSRRPGAGRPNQSQAGNSSRGARLREGGRRGTWRRRALPSAGPAPRIMETGGRPTPALRSQSCLRGGRGPRCPLRLWDEHPHPRWDASS